MAHSFAEMRKNRKADLAKLNDQIEKSNSKFTKSSDDRFWEPTVDKDGNGYAVIRFLPPPKGEDDYFIRRWDHGFKGPTGKWYINLSRSSIGEDDPCGDMNSKLWNQGEGSEGRKVVQGTPDRPGSKRRLHYIANIYVVEDSSKPENNGTVRLYKFGKKIFDKLNDVMNPKFKDETPINPFDLFEGADFKLKIRKVEGYRNYDKSEFNTQKVGPLLGFDEDKLEEIWGQEHSLQAFLDPKTFKSYEELQKQLNKVMDLEGTAATRASQEDEKEEVVRSSTRKEPADDKPPFSTDDEDDEDGLSFFSKLAGG